MLSAEYNFSVQEAQTELQSLPPQQHITQNTGTQNKTYFINMTFKVLIG
jgi:hypothetical protein